MVRDSIAAERRKALELELDARMPPQQQTAAPPAAARRHASVASLLEVRARTTRVDAERLRREATPRGDHALGGVAHRGGAAVRRTDCGREGAVRISRGGRDSAES